MPGIEVIAFDAPLGAEIRCGDIRTLDDTAIAAIRQAWLAHLVVLFRGQRLSDEDLIAFGRRFGDLQISKPLPDPRVSASTGLIQGGSDAAHPEVTVVSNIVDNGVVIGGLGDGELVWHSDMSSYVAPPAQTILYGIEVTDRGGETGFVNMYAALEALAPGLRNRARELALKHDATVDAAGYPRKGFDHELDLTKSAGTVHPLVRTHPETGCDCLYLGRRSKAYLVGHTVEQSDRLLEQLWAEATQPHLTWHHRWQPGDVLMWDNRCTMHRRNPFDPAARRLLRRVVVKGTAPALATETPPAHRRATLALSHR
jgi:taurine dioxygenase